MTTRVHDNLIRGVVILILFLALIFHSVIMNAQSRRYSAGPYKGFVANFGARAATLSSDIEKINESALLQAGGQVGLIFGNEIVRSKVGLLGYYSSTNVAAGTTDLYNSNIAVNIYPLAWVTGHTSLIAPYITGSVDYDQYKFFGHYLHREPGSINYSQTEAPYLGKVTQVNATVGLGLEVSLKNDYDFIHLFSEVRYGHNLSTNASDAAFSETTINAQTTVSVGVSFGMHR